MVHCFKYSDDQTLPSQAVVSFLAVKHCARDMRLSGLWETAKMVQVSLSPYMFAECISCCLNVPIPTVINVWAHYPFPPRFAVSVETFRFQALALLLECSVPVKWRPQLTTSLLCCNRTFAVSFKLYYVWDCFLRGRSEIVEGTIYFTFSPLCKSTMILCMSPYPFESKFSMHALLERDREGRRQKRCRQLLYCKAPTYYCGKCGIRSQKNNMDWRNVEYIYETFQLHQAVRMVTIMDDQFRNQNALNKCKSENNGRFLGEIKVGG